MKANMLTQTAKERPILFSGAMVRALLDGRKTQTRRRLKQFQCPTFDPSKDTDADMAWSAIAQKDPRWGFAVFGGTEQECAANLSNSGCCPYGRRGERLWVRETHSFVPDHDEPAGCSAVLYAADGEQYGKLRPSIHMPRWASRIQLEIVSVRVERLTSCSAPDAVAEGLARTPDGHAWHVEDEQHRASDPVDAYASLWEAINGPGSWERNPWVWVVEFRRV